jgi:hypothetical protein
MQLNCNIEEWLTNGILPWARLSENPRPARHPRSLGAQSPANHSQPAQSLSFQAMDDQGTLIEDFVFDEALSSLGPAVSWEGTCGCSSLAVCGRAMRA